MTISIYDLIAFQARIRPGAPAVFCHHGIIRYGQLLRHIDAMISEIQKHDIRATEPVALIYPRTYVHLLLVLALDRMNVPSVSLLTSNAKVPWKLASPLVVFSNKKPEFDLPHRWIELSEGWLPRALDAESAPFANPPDSLVRVILSSGSTGSPKAVAITRRVLIARIAEHARDLALTEHSRAMPLHLIAGGPGYWTSLAVLAVGGMLVLLKQLQLCVQHADVLKVTHLSCSPYILERWIEIAVNLPPLTSLEILETAGSHLPTAVARQAKEVVSRNLYSAYGTTEAGRIAFTRAGSAPAAEGAVGYVSPWCTVEIVDDADLPLPSDSEGIVRLRTPSMIDSYYVAPELTARNLRDGWFYPGDIGILSKGGLLRITGRSDDVINLGGVKMSLLAAEERLRSVPGTRDVAAFAMPIPGRVAQLWAAIVRQSSVPADRLNAAMAEAKISRVIYVDNIPRTESGKIVRRTLAEAAQRTLEGQTQSDARLLGGATAE